MFRDLSLPWTMDIIWFTYDKALPHRIGQKVDFGTQDTCIKIVQLGVLSFSKDLGRKCEAHQHSSLSHNGLFWLVGPVTTYPAGHSVS